MDEEVIMAIRGRLAKLMMKTAPHIYWKYITLDFNNHPVLYVKIHKALYRCLRSALLFYEKFIGDLETKGFELDPYHPCVANKMIEGNQFTTTWYIYDIKLSHIDSAIVTRVINWLKNIYGEDMRVSRGKLHDYLWMTLDFTMKGEVKVRMVDYLKWVINDFPEVITGSAATPATDNLFDVHPDEERTLIYDKRARSCYHSVAQLPFASSISRNYIHMTTTFLTTRLKSPDEDDWGKLKRVLKYIMGTVYTPLAPKAGSLNILKW
jgi:hypothetical protein